ncbi:hypothetical protein C8J56DRAFT_1055687 [Mycena floridula]|nr:hypothetical protein C8J56DRAFT_1055687 [Mycena floridula]
MELNSSAVNNKIPIGPYQRPALNAVMDAENDTEIALAAIEAFATESTPIDNAMQPVITNAEISTVKKELDESLAELKDRNHIFSNVPTAQQFIDLADEDEESTKHQLGVENSSIIKIDDNDADCDDIEQSSLTVMQFMELSRRLEQFCLEKVDKARTDLQKESEAKKVQKDLYSFWAPKP